MKSFGKKGSSVNWEGEKGSQFFETFKGWRVAYINFTQMKKHGRVLSSKKIISFRENRLEGEFHNGKLNGQGKKTYTNGRVSEGKFVNGKLNGQGKIALIDGKKQY